MSYGVDTRCSNPDCEETIPSNKFSHIKSGWFFQKNGDSWCPEHIPDWYEEWKKKTPFPKPED